MPVPLGVGAARYAGLDIGNAVKTPPEGGAYTLAPPSAARRYPSPVILSEAKDLKMRRPTPRSHVPVASVVAF